MTNPLSQFLILISLTGIGAVAGSALALIDFADKSIGGRAVLRFVAEFAVVSAVGVLMWVVILYMNGGALRLFFFIPPLIFALICNTCIQKLLSPRLKSAREAVNRFKNSRKGNFIVKYILK